MSMDGEDLRVVACPVCEAPVQDYEPGVSSLIVGGLLFHPGCAPIDEREVENTPRRLSAPELMRVRELVPKPHEFLPETAQPRRWFDVYDGTGQQSLVLSGGLFIQNALYCDRHQLVDACECATRVRLSGLLEQQKPDLAERMHFHLEVIDVLTRGINATRKDRQPIMDDEEEAEMCEDFEAGKSARDFALRLCNRDVATWEAASEPYPERAFPTAEND